VGGLVETFSMNANDGKNFELLRDSRVVLYATVTIYRLPLCLHVMCCNLQVLWNDEHILLILELIYYQNDRSC